MTLVKWMGGVVLGGAMGLACLSASAETNLCYNARFTSGTDPLDGWNLNFDWTGNTKYEGNHLNASFLPEYKGRKNVLKMAVPKEIEARVETPIMEYEPGDRYQCTFDFLPDVGVVRVLFLGYTWRPGVAPNEAPKLQDMRRIYKGDAQMVKGAAWKTVTVTFPHEQISELAYSHLKKVRYVTVMWIVPGATGYSGAYYISNLKVVKLPTKCKVTKGPVKPSDDEE